VKLALLSNGWRTHTAAKRVPPGRVASGPEALGLLDRHPEVRCLFTRNAIVHGGVLAPGVNSSPSRSPPRAWCKRFAMCSVLLDDKVRADQQLARRIWRSR